MSPELTSTLARIEAECRRAIELRDRLEMAICAQPATSETDFLYFNIRFSPAAAQALLASIEALKAIYKDDLEAIDHIRASYGEDYIPTEGWDKTLQALTAIAGAFGEVL